MIRVLILCAGNSARSIMAEVILNHLGAGKFVAASAGSQPAGAVNPAALRQLERHGHDSQDLASKSWEQFAAQNNDEPIDLIITVCDNAASEACPVWPGSPVTVHWGIPDPAAADKEAMDAAFADAYQILRSRLEALVALPIAVMSPVEITIALNAVAAHNPTA